jgi:hypothetical protein
MGRATKVARVPTSGLTPTQIAKGGAQFINLLLFLADVKPGSALDIIEVECSCRGECRCHSGKSIVCDCELPK